MDEENWKPMASAPTDTIVQVGRWENWMDKTEWKTKIGFVFRGYFFGLLKKRTYHGEEYTHWRELPHPPKHD